MSRIKGAVFREFVGWLQDDQGIPAVDALVEAMPAPDRPVFHRGARYLGLLSASWYDTGSVHAFLDALRDAHDSRAIDRIVHDGAVASLNRTLTGVHRAMLRVVGSPDLHARFAQRLWDTYYDEGEVISTRVRPTAQRIAYRGWRAHHGLLCRITSAADEVVFPQMGLRGVSVSQECCIDRGASECAHVVQWE